MKKLLMVLAIALLVITGCASTEDIENAVSEMSVVIEAEGKSADELFVLANSWAVDTFNSAEAVIEFSDKESGIIKGTFSYSISGFNNYDTETTMTIEVREGRLRITFNNPIARMSTLMGQPTTLSAWPWQECTGSQLAELNKIWNAMIIDLENNLNIIEEDW